jgi:DUF1365 family protein
VNSALYEGTLRHHRHGEHPHAFRMGVAMPLLDLAEIDAAFAPHPLWSVERRNVASFRRADYLGDPGTPLDIAVRALVHERTGDRPTGPVRVLTHVRTWGWLFNPITIYFCMDDDGERVETVVLDVTNTPWHEHHAYVIPGGAGEHRFPKELHVSPFFGMDHEYVLRLSEPGDNLSVQLSLLDGDDVVFDASLALRRRPICRSSLGRVLWRYPLLTMRVTTGIYVQAARLWSKRAPLFPHPSRRAGRDAVAEVAAR